MRTTEDDHYCLVVRRPLRYVIAYVGVWPDLLDQVAIMKARGVDVESIRAIPFSQDRRINQTQALNAFAHRIPEPQTVPASTRRREAILARKERFIPSGNRVSAAITRRARHPEVAPDPVTV